MCVMGRATTASCPGRGGRHQKLRETRGVGLCNGVLWKSSHVSEEIAMRGQYERSKGVIAAAGARIASRVSGKVCQ